MFAHGLLQNCSRQGPTATKSTHTHIFQRETGAMFRLRCAAWFHRPLQSFEISDIPIRWYTFKRRPVQSAGTPDLELPKDAGGEPSAADEELQAAEADEAEENEESGDEDVPEEVVPPPPALKVVYAPGKGERFLLALGTWARGAIFECSWQVREICPLVPPAPLKKLVETTGLPVSFTIVMIYTL